MSRQHGPKSGIWRLPAVLAAVGLLTGATVTNAQQDTREPISEDEDAVRAELMGWGPRVGVATDPDQIVGGFHWDVGRITPHLRIVPNLEIGVGDDHTIGSVTIPLHYVFRDVDVNFYPYVGGGLAIGYIDRDLPPQSSADDDDVEAAFKAIGGLEWRLTRKTDFFAEANVVVGDIHDVQLMVGWTFR